jgi:hypothetical protein
LLDKSNTGIDALRNVAVPHQGYAGEVMTFRPMAVLVGDEMDRFACVDHMNSRFNGRTRSAACRHHAKRALGYQSLNDPLERSRFAVDLKHLAPSGLTCAPCYIRSGG